MIESGFFESTSVNRGVEINFSPISIQFTKIYCLWPLLDAKEPIVEICPIKRLWAVQPLDWRQ